MIKLDSNTCAYEISVCFTKVTSELVHLEEKLANQKTFVFAEERDQLFHIPGNKIRWHRGLLMEKMMRRMLLREIDRNLLEHNQGYFNFLQNCFSRYFNYISQFNDAIAIFFNDRETARTLVYSLIYAESDGLLSSLSLPEPPKLDKDSFRLAVQVYIIDTFYLYEQFLFTQYPAYQCHLKPDLFPVTDHRDFINLKFDKRRSALSLIHSDLFDGKFIKCTESEFVGHFGIGSYTDKIDWYSSEINLVFLFFGSPILPGLFKDEVKIHWCRKIADHFFYKKLNKEFIPTRLQSVSYKDSPTGKGSDLIVKLLKKLVNY